MNETETDPAAALEVVRGQARRYLEARYGKAVWYRAPETFTNALERWLWAISSESESASGLAEECIAAIEAHFAGDRR